MSEMVFIFITVIQNEPYIYASVVVIGRIRKIAKSDYELRRVSLSAWNNSPPTVRIFVQFIS
jgi:hypothetical protein